MLCVHPRHSLIGAGQTWEDAENSSNPLSKANQEVMVPLRLDGPLSVSPQVVRECKTFQVVLALRLQAVGVVLRYERDFWP